MPFPRTSRTLIFLEVVHLHFAFHLSNPVIRRPNRALPAIHLTANSGLKYRFLCGFVQRSPTPILTPLRFRCLRHPSPTRFDPLTQHSKHGSRSARVPRVLERPPSRQLDSSKCHTYYSSTRSINPLFVISGNKRRAQSIASFFFLPGTPLCLIFGRIECDSQNRTRRRPRSIRTRPMLILELPGGKSKGTWIKICRRSRCLGVTFLSLAACEI